MTKQRTVLGFWRTSMPLRLLALGAIAALSLGLWINVGCGNGSSGDTIKTGALTPEDQATLDAAVTQGAQAVRDGDYNAALEAVGPALLLDPRNTELQRVRGSAFAGRAGISVGKLNQDFLAGQLNEETGAYEITFDSFMGGVLTTANYYDPAAFDFLLADGRKALAVYLPKGLNTGFPTEAKARSELAAVAGVQYLRYLAYVLEGESPQNMTDEAIAAAVAERYDSIQDDFELSYAVFLETKNDLIHELFPDPLVAAAALVQWAEIGLPAYPPTQEGVTTFLQTIRTK